MIMARTYLTADNSRGKAVTASGSTRAHLSSWTAGVLVRMVAGRPAGPPAFTVSMTTGSNGGADGYWPIGTVREGRAGDPPVFEPDPAMLAAIPLAVRAPEVSELVVQLPPGEWGANELGIVANWLTDHGYDIGTNECRCCFGGAFDPVDNLPGAECAVCEHPAAGHE